MKILLCYRTGRNHRNRQQYTNDSKNEMLFSQFFSNRHLILIDFLKEKIKKIWGLKEQCVLLLVNLYKNIRFHSLMLTHFGML